MTINVDLPFLLWFSVLYNAQIMARMFYITVSTFLAATLIVIYFTVLCYYASLFLALAALGEDD